MVFSKARSEPGWSSFPHLLYDINLVRAAVWLDRYVVDHLVPYFINAYGSRFFMTYHDNVRMILANGFFAGIAFHDRAPLPLSSHWSVVANVAARSFFPDPGSPGKYIRMGHLSCFYGIFYMPDYFLMSNNVIKSNHWKSPHNSYFLFHTAGYFPTLHLYFIIRIFVIPSGHTFSSLIRLNIYFIIA